MSIAVLRLVACGLAVMLCDIIFVGFIMRRPYVKMVENVQKSRLSLRKLPALLASLSVVIGLWTISLSNDESWNARDQRNAAVFGLTAVLIYNATNLAVFVEWSVQNAIIDTFYGTILCALTYAAVVGLISKETLGYS